jgi:hypothetical protein
MDAPYLPAARSGGRPRSTGLRTVLTCAWVMMDSSAETRVDFDATVQRQKGKRRSSVS